MNVIFNSTDLIDVCKKNMVLELYIFGSAVRQNFTEQSDIDLLVELSDLDPIERRENLISLWDSLEKIFNRKIDLVTKKSLHNEILIKPKLFIRA